MAKNEVFEGDPNAFVLRTELKKELLRIVESIAEESSSGEENRVGFTESVEKLNQILQELKEGRKSKHRSSSCKQRNSDQSNNGGTTSSLASCPPEFRCPLSKELMRDPVIIASGQTYDRHTIQNWLKHGNRTCPKTQQVLSHTILTPNHLVRDLITQWCKNHHVKIPSPVSYSDQDVLPEPDRARFLNLLTKMSSTLSDQKEAAKTLRSLTKKTPSFRALFGETEDSIPQLLTPLTLKSSKIDDGLHEDLITTLLNISIYESNKKLVAERPMVISILMDALRSERIETRSNAAAAIFTLSALDSNKLLIGKAGAMKPLFELLDEGNPVAMKDVASAIFNLCMDHENKGRALRTGGVRVLLEKIVSRVLVDELLAILAMISSNPKAVEEMVDRGGFEILISLMKETNCARNKENCIAILYNVCYNDRSRLKEMREEENAYGTLSELARNGTSRAKRKANGILDRLRRAGHTA